MSTERERERERERQKEREWERKWNFIQNRQMKIATHCKQIEWWGRLDKGYLPCGCVTGGESDVVNDCIFPSPMRSPIGHWCYTPITKYVSWLCLSFCCVEIVMYINNNEENFHKLRKRMSQPSNQKLLLDSTIQMSIGNSYPLWEI